MLEDLEFAWTKVKDKSAFGHEDGVGRGHLLPKGACAADIAFGEFCNEDLHGATLGGEDEGFSIGRDKKTGRWGILLYQDTVGFDGLEEKGL